MYLRFFDVIYWDPVSNLRVQFRAPYVIILRKFRLIPTTQSSKIIEIISYRKFPPLYLRIVVMLIDYSDFSVFFIFYTEDKFKIRIILDIHLNSATFELISKDEGGFRIFICPLIFPRVYVNP